MKRGSVENSASLPPALDDRPSAAAVLDDVDDPDREHSYRTADGDRIGHLPGRRCRTGHRRTVRDLAIGQQRCGHVDVVLFDALYGVHDVIELHGHRVLIGARVDYAEQEVVPDAGDLQNDGDDEDGR